MPYLPGMTELGMIPVRLGVDRTELGLHTWQEHRKSSGVSPRDADDLAQSARRAGSIPTRWLVPSRYVSDWPMRRKPGKRLTRLRRDWRFAVVLSIFSAAIALVSALEMRGEVRLVSIALLFAGGFGAGAGIASAVARRNTG